jgi:hypothetical protein
MVFPPGELFSRFCAGLLIFRRLIAHLAPQSAAHASDLRMLSRRAQRLSRPGGSIDESPSASKPDASSGLPSSHRSSARE